MARKGRRLGHSAADPAFPNDPQAYAASLERRRKAAQGLQQELLTSVPLLYGSPGEAGGDPGIELARAHREDMLRRHGGSPLQASGRRSEVVLPFERAIAALAFLLYLLFFFAD